MLDRDELPALLHALITGFPDRARNIVATSPHLDEEPRSLLWAALEAEAATPGDALSALGDALREAGAEAQVVNEVYRAAFYAGPHWQVLTEDPLFAQFAANRAGKVIDKWPHYFPIYTRYLSKYRGKAPKVLEIGVYRGGSMQMWARFFGPEASLVGLDIDEVAIVAAEDSQARYSVVLADQEDRDALAKIAQTHGPFDVVIDDGGHTMSQQIASVEALFPLLADGGTYIVEDCHTSYWDTYGGGRGLPGTFIEWVKERVDDLNAYHQPGAVDPVWTRSLDGVHVHDSVVVLDKAARFAPFSEQTGGGEFVYSSRQQSALVSEMVATRQAAVDQRDQAVASSARRDAELEAEQARAENDLRRVRGDLAAIRARLAESEKELVDTSAELEQTRNNLLESWQHVREMRATMSWRVTAPLRRMRGRA